MQIIPSFFKTRKPKQFNYSPRFYDEQAELRRERNRMIAREMGIVEDEPDHPDAVKARLRMHWQNNFVSKRSRLQVQHRNANLRLLAVLILVLWVFYRFLFS